MAHGLKLFLASYLAFIAGICLELALPGWGTNTVTCILLADILVIATTMLSAPVNEKSQRALETQTYIAIGLVVALYPIFILDVLGC